MSKTIIIGGGVAGLSLAIALRKMGLEVVVCEREVRTHTNGHAFLIHPEAMRVLQDIIETDPYHLMPGRKIEQLFLKNSHDELIQEVDLEGWICMKRCEAMAALAAELPEGVIQYGCQFSHFIRHDEKVVSAVFKNGSVVHGDIFIGADGAKSSVRSALFGPTNYTPVLVKEILGTIKNKSLFDRHPNHFTKYLSVDKGLAVGFIPCNDEELIWFMQFDVNLHPGEFASEDTIAAFCRSALTDFPDEVREVMDCKSVVANYIWNTTDFDVLPCFHKWNVLLIGDAAHLALPFTSAGVTNALLDVDCLIRLWTDEIEVNNLFTEFYNHRSTHIQGHVEMGRLIRSSFLKGAAVETRLPLIQDLSVLSNG
jgi:2-polyprenyl-6-methoxyphenol hydroxylase-like FAD-dependent oxidoreductase